MIEIEHLDYHEDKVINGILHYRDGASWKEYSKEELTEMYLDEQKALDDYIHRQIEEEGFDSCGVY
jgi:hypothetical protein